MLVGTLQTPRGHIKGTSPPTGVLPRSYGSFIRNYVFVLMHWRLISVGHHLYSNPDYQTAFLYYGCYISNQPLFLLPGTIILYRSQAKNVMVDGILMASRWVVKTDWLLLKHLYAEGLKIPNATSQTGRFLIYTCFFSHHTAMSRTLEKWIFYWRENFVICVVLIVYFYYK